MYLYTYIVSPSLHVLHARVYSTTHLPTYLATHKHGYLWATWEHFPPTYLLAYLSIYIPTAHLPAYPPN